MPDRHSPLSAALRPGTFGAQHDGGPGVILAERRGLAHVHLAGRPTGVRFLDAARSALALGLPTKPNTVARSDRYTVFWLAPTRWLVESATVPAPDLEARLRERIDGLGAVTPATGGRTVVRLTGRAARRLLAKGVPLDLHPSAFPPGTCAQTALAGAAVLLHALPPDGAAVDLYIPRSHALHLVEWLEDAALEFGCRIEAPEEEQARP